MLAFKYARARARARALLLCFFIFTSAIKCVEHYYVLQNCKKDPETKLTCEFQYTPPTNDEFYNLNELSSPTVDDNKIIKRLKLEIENIRTTPGGSMVHLKLFNLAEARYEVPRYILSPDFQELKPYNKPIPEKTVDKNFIQIIDPDTLEVLFTLFQKELMFADDYIIYDYLFTTNDIFGYGERATSFKLKNGTYTAWANDTGGIYEDDGLGGRNLYGMHPFTMIRHKGAASAAESNNGYIGILFLNSNAQDLEIKSNGVVKQITIGGIVELFIWFRKSPLDVIVTYHDLVGKPNLPPYWSLGWHQCRYGYVDTDNIKDVVENYIKYKIPLDVIWADIDYMDKYYDFTIDPINFKELPQWISQIKKERNIRFVPIIDLGIANKTDNPYWPLGVSSEGFIMSNYTNEPIINTVWPGTCAFPNFLHKTNGKILWNKGLQNFKEMIEYDGVWVDMNEPGTFTNFELCDPKKMTEEKNKYRNLTYNVGNGRIKISDRTLSPNAYFPGEGTEFNTVYNLRTINTFMQNKITHDFLVDIKKRPFIISRSSFAGMGRYSQHWLGDNFSTYASMKSSIPGIFNAQMFGFNMAGADICGFMADTTDELCARWTNLGVFYPFSRNHNNKGQVDQEPWALGELTLNANKRAIPLRYSILRYMYTQMYLSSISGGVMYQPLFFQFPEIPELLTEEKSMNEQVMVGPALLLSPALEEKETDYDAQFPYGNWNEFPSGKPFLSTKDFTGPNTLKKMTLSGSYDVINLHMRGGYIIPYQNVYKYKPLTTVDLTKIPLTIIVNPDENGKATGELILDDDIANPLKTIEEKKYFHAKFEYNRPVFKVTILNMTPYDKVDAYIENIIVYQSGKQDQDQKTQSLRFLNRNNLTEMVKLDKVGIIEIE